MRPAGRQSSVIRFPSTCCAVYILSQHRADFSTGSACGPLRVCFALNRCEDSLTFFTQYFAPETGAHSERVSERRYVFRGSRSTDRSKNPRSIPSGILHRWLFRNRRTRPRRDLRGTQAGPGSWNQRPGASHSQLTVRRLPCASNRLRRCNRVLWREIVHCHIVSNVFDLVVPMHKNFTSRPVLSLKSRLHSTEHVKEHSHAEASKRIDKRREQRCCRNQTPQDIENVEDERPHQKSRYQNRSDQC
jgi:hypothetical protein